MKQLSVDKVLNEIKKLKEENALLKQKDSIAVIGMACRYPLADNLDQYWDVLANGKNAIREIPENREELKEYYKQFPNKKIRGGFLEDISAFDAPFFNIGALEANNMDPQHRLLLEVAYHALENAGINVKNLSGSPTGVFVGTTNGEYFFKNVKQQGEEMLNSYSAIGGTLSAAACRLSYYLGLEGPSMIIDTACSSSLVALDAACNNLISGSCSVAIAAGVNSMVSPVFFETLLKLNALSPDGLCQTFDDNANGYVRGEGCGVVILKRLSDAVKDKDRILGIIRGISVNQDGKSNGFTAPNQKAQEKVILNALEKAGVSPYEVSYLETHGTGTKLGDPIEVSALSEAYKRNNSNFDNPPLYIGSVKTNIGHLESAAGMAGFIKVLLAFQHKKIPAHLHLNTPNKFISWDTLNVKVPKTTIEWPSAKKRLAALSSFGFTGTNVHLIVEEGNTTIENKNTVSSEILTISAKTKEALVDIITAYRKYLSNTSCSIQDFCFTANTGRAHYKERIILEVTSKEDAINKLLAVEKGEDIQFLGITEFSGFNKMRERYSKGEELNWNEYYNGKNYHKINIPYYPFQQKSYWCGRSIALQNEINDNQNSGIKQSILIDEQFLSELKELPVDERRSYLIKYFQAEIASILGINDISLIDVNVGFFQLGLDSLMAVELKNRVEKKLNATIPSTAIFDYPTITDVTNFLIDELLPLDFGKLEEEVESKETNANILLDEPIAIIGMACRFPGKATSIENFWDVLKNGENTITEVPIDRWNLEEYYHVNPDAPGKTYTRYGSFLKSIDQFDPLFFGISPREALSMDPQQRILLEVSWQALNNAKQNQKALKGSQTGVFIGVSSNEYGKFFLEKDNLKNIDAYFITGNALNATAGRISYLLGLQGPSMAIDTACSSSLVAIHNACQSLRIGESNMAIVGGLNLMLGPESTIAMAKTKLLSPSGKCKTFDESADGIVRGEGCGVLILKRLSDAIRDNDPILAHIKGSAVNQDGASSGFTVPSGSSQKKLITQALKNAKLSPNDIDYIEAHGTGTALGDPIEVNAMASAFAKGRNPESPLLIGSVKTNIGHLEAVAGIAGLIKVVLSLQHKLIPSHLNVASPNSKIAWENIPIKINLKNQAWIKNQDRKRRAGVSSFGATGTNAHLIVEEAETENSPIDNKPLDFKKQKYWIADSSNFKPLNLNANLRIHPLLDNKIYSPILKEVIYENELNLVKYPFLEDHKVYNNIVLPGAYYISTILAAAIQENKSNHCVLQDVLFYQPLIIPSKDSSIKLQINIAKDKDEKQSYKIISFNAEDIRETKEFLLHSSGIICNDSSIHLFKESINIDKKEYSEEFDGDMLYSLLSQFNVQIEGAFQWINKIWKAEKQAWALFKNPNKIENLKDFELHPCIIDSCVQFASATVGMDKDETYLPFSISKLSYFQSPQSNELWCHVSKVESNDTNKPVANVKLLDKEGNLILLIEGIEYKKIVRFSSNEINQKENYLYKLSWKEKELKSVPQNGNSENWLILSNNRAYNELISKHLSALNYKSIFVYTGDKYLCINENEYYINPSDPQQYKKLLNEIYGTSLSSNCKGVIHLWSFNNPINNLVSITQIQDSYNTGVYSGLYLIHALSRQKWSSLPKLYIVSDLVHDYNSLEIPTNFYHAPLWALGKVIMNEYPEFNCKLIDLVGSLGKLAEELFATDNEKEVIIRNEKRYVARLIRKKSKNLSKKEEAIFQLNKNATYMVTGGFGDLGIMTIRWLLKKGAKNIVCTSRKNSISNEAKELIEKAEASGAKIRLMQTDVADLEQMKALFTEMSNNMPPLKGIFHLAGMVDDGLLMGQTQERFEKVFRPKIDGLWNLHQISLNLPLDYFVCFSSMTSIWASPGQGNYAAANAFMDSLMNYRKNTGLPALSINWGPWDQIGMASRLNALSKNRMQENGLAFLLPDDAIYQFEKLLNETEAQIAIVNINWNKHLKLISKSGNPLLFDEIDEQESEQEKNKGILLQKLTDLEIENRKDYLFNYVQAEIANVLGISDSNQIALRKPLFELGLDSFMAIELKNKFEKDLNIKLNSSLLFNYPNLESIVHFLISDIIPLDFSDSEDKKIIIEDTIEKQVNNMTLQEVSDELDIILKEI